MKGSVVAAGFILLGTMLPAQVHAQARGWKTLATVRILPARDGESVTVRTNQQPFREIRVCADHRSVPITEVRVNFVRGNRQQINVQRTIRAGACSNAARLRQQNASIRSIYVGHGRVRATATPSTVRVQAR
jgi:hypothetical protein